MIMNESLVNTNSGVSAPEVVGTPAVHVAVARVAELVTSFASTLMNEAFLEYSEVKKFTPLSTTVVSALSLSAATDVIRGIVPTSWGAYSQLVPSNCVHAVVNDSNFAVIVMV